MGTSGTSRPQSHVVFTKLIDAMRDLCGIIFLFRFTCDGQIWGRPANPQATKNRAQGPASVKRSDEPMPCRACGVDPDPFPWRDANGLLRMPVRPLDSRRAGPIFRDILQAKACG